MRKDMSKVIVERPRLGGGVRRKGRTEALTDDEGEALRQRVPKKKQTRTKSLNENLAPLRRYLESQAGRPWNKVRSDISKHLRPTSTVQQHVIDHIGDFVALNTAMVDGKVIARDDIRGNTQVEDSWYRLYVHPKSGLLLKNEARKTFRRRRMEAIDTPASRRRALGPLRQAHRFGDGAWWDVVLERQPERKETVRDWRGVPVTRRTPLPFEDVVVARGLSDMELKQLYGRAGVYAVSARRLTRAERKKLDLP
ncbi:MAG: hypothetical protein GC155_11955 [Alphaproteobacteria bacterium]|nr:hypothetical protein [Alphaproteobacteria bacterium]